MRSQTEEQCLGYLFSQPVPTGKVRYWEDDGQGGGRVLYVTPEEAASLDEEEREERRERAQWILFAPEGSYYDWAVLDAWAEMMEGVML